MMTHAMMTVGMICQNCAHFALFRGERDGWEAVLGACRHRQGRVQQA